VIVASVGSVVVGVTARWLGEADIARRQSERRVRVLLAELDHRVRNTMAAVYSISEQTAARSESLEDFRKSYRGRLQAMARAHEALSSQRWQSVSLRQIVDTVVGAYSLVDGRTLQIQGEDVVLPSSAAMSLAITLNELATNAIKHGAWSVTSSLGQVKVAWGLTAPDELELDWQESGGPPPGVTSRTSFGFELIRGMVPHDMGGEVNLLMDPSGLRCRIRASIASARERSQTRTATVD
jgi:two-component sensor histidine kinase